MTRAVAALAAIVLALGIAGCGGSETGGAAGDTSGTTTTAASPPAGSLQALAGAKPIALVAGTSDYAPGVNRYSFLVVTGDNRMIEAPTARVWVAKGLRQKPFAQAIATLEQVAATDGSSDATRIYVVRVPTPTPGTYWLLAKPTGSDVAALGNMVVGKHAAAPAVGDRAIPSQNPTLGRGVDPKTVTTAEPVDRVLLQTTVAKAMAAHRPFVVTFATPLYCQSRTCGPVVQVVESVAERSRSSGVDFIHVEIYEDNDPSKGVNRWVDEWRLPTEPFTFVVDRKGVIRSRFEGAFSAAELENALQQVIS